MYFTMIYYFFAAFFCVLNLFSDRLSDIAADIHNVNSIAEIYLAIMSGFKTFHLFTIEVYLGKHNGTEYWDKVSKVFTDWKDVSTEFSAL